MSSLYKFLPSNTLTVKNPDVLKTLHQKCKCEIQFYFTLTVKRWIKHLNKIFGDVTFFWREFSSFALSSPARPGTLSVDSCSIKDWELSFVNLCRFYCFTSCDGIISK